MKLKTLVLSVIGGILWWGTPAFADPTYSVYSDPPVVNGGTLRYGFNDLGYYVGWSFSRGTYYGFLMGPGGATSPIAPPSAIDTHPTGINDNNVMVGYFSDSSGTHAFVNAGGSYTTLNAPGAVATYAYGVSNRNRIVGYFVDAHGLTHAFIEYAGVFRTIDIPGAVATYGLAIDQSGDIIGSYFDGTAIRGFIYRSGFLELVDYPDAAVTWLTGINDDGTVVGWERSCATCGSGAFVKPADGFFTLMHAAGVRDSYLTDINDDGLGLGPSGLYDELGSPEETRRRSVVAAIPEPGNIALVATGLFALVFARRFRRKR